MWLEFVRRLLGMTSSVGSTSSSVEKSETENGLPTTTKILAWGARVDRAFVDKVLEICKEFKWTDDQANHLMACIAFESAETFSPSIRNGAGSGATGLIQFMPTTALGLGTTTEHLATLSAVQQLDWVAKYFKPYHKRVKTLSDMYMAILLPRYIGRPEDSTLFSNASIAYRQNSALDGNNDGRITKAEAADRVRKKLFKGLESGRALHF